MAFGICTLLALLLRKRMGFKFVPTREWRESFSLTHTAIAAGCIPAVLVILLAPSLLASLINPRKQLRKRNSQTSRERGKHIQGRVSVPVLNGAEISHMHSGPFGQPLQRPFLALANTADALAELLSQLGGAAPAPKGLDHLL